ARGVELPAVLVAGLDLGRALQLLAVLVVDAERLADLVDDVLVGRRIVAARGLVAAAVSRLPVGIDVARGDGRAGLVRFADVLQQLLAPGAGGRGRAAGHAERRRDGAADRGGVAGTGRPGAPGGFLGRGDWTGGP